MIIYFFLQKDFDFKLKVVGSEVSTIPGISDAIEVGVNLFFLIILAFL